MASSSPLRSSTCHSLALLALTHSRAHPSLSTPHHHATNRPGMYEYELEAVFTAAAMACSSPQRGFTAGCQLGYPCIVGAGANAAILHYERNSTRVGAGDLVLVDAGERGARQACACVCVCVQLGVKVEGLKHSLTHDCGAVCMPHTDTPSTPAPFLLQAASMSAIPPTSPAPFPPPAPSASSSGTSIRRCWTCRPWGWSALLPARRGRASSRWEAWPGVCCGCEC